VVIIPVIDQLSVLGGTVTRPTTEREVQRSGNSVEVCFSQVNGLFVNYGSNVGLG